MRRQIANCLAVAPLIMLGTITPHAVNRMPVGGGTTKAGLMGEYFANPSFQGKPVFTRRDVRFHHDWKESPAGQDPPVGGASTPGMKDFPLGDSSIRWTRQVVTRFSETYTFRITFRAKPNIIMIMLDDQGIDGFGCYGGDNYSSLRIDRLAEEGMRFTRGAYATPLCAPTRALLITGQYSFRNGCIGKWTSKFVDHKERPSMPRIMKRAGYVTGVSGKWHINRAPSDWRFDEVLKSPTANGYYYGEKFDGAYEVNGREVKMQPGQYFPDVANAFAVDFIARHKDKPFFLYRPLHLPHVPYFKTPDSADDSTSKESLHRDYVAYIDKLVGQIVDAVDHHGIAQDTYIIVTADNGSLRPGKVNGKSILGGKNDMRDCSALVPFLVRCPGRIAAGATCDDLIDFTDLIPTFAELAGGAELPEGQVLDGRSFAPQLHGQSGSPREWVFVQLGEKWFARDKNYRLNEDGSLYNITGTPHSISRITPERMTPEDTAALEKLQAVLDRLDPKSGRSYHQADTFMSAKQKAKKGAH